VVSPEWQAAQNSDAYDFARPLLKANFAKLDTAGVLYGGRRCFVLLRTREGFQLPGGDDTEGFILVQISHEYGIADLVIPTSVRVVCRNTLQFALDKATQAQLNDGRFVHRAKTSFSVEKAEALIEAYRQGLGAYAEQAKFLSTKRATPEQTRAYINRVFKLQALREGTDQQKKWRTDYNEGVVKKLMNTLETQPGGETMSPGTWWASFNAVTHWEDHAKYMKDQQEAIASKLYGTSSERKVRALATAMEMAS
jgi:phage/plasmid-like protein (TIGR03299 family)